MQSKFHKLYFEYYNINSLSRALRLDIEYHKIQKTNVDSTNIKEIRIEKLDTRYFLRGKPQKRKHPRVESITTGKMFFTS